MFTPIPRYGNCVLTGGTYTMPGWKEQVATGPRSPIFGVAFSLSKARISGF
jgi:hypothetical protein